MNIVWINQDSCTINCGKQVALLSRDIHIWSVPYLKLSGPRIDELENIITLTERKRADAFYFHKDRTAYIAVRGMLRVILGMYLQEKPQSIEIVYNAYGKPHLAFQNNLRTLQFNITHSNGLALMAFTHMRKIGIDVELVRMDESLGPIADAFFSRPEAMLLKSVNNSKKSDVFFTLWTRKEALLKAMGCGLSLPLDKIDVSEKFDTHDRIVNIGVEGSSDWSLLSFHPKPGYAAAIAVEGRIENLNFIKLKQFYDYLCIENID